MGMSNKAISTALSTHLKVMVNLPPVAWENAKFTPSNGLYLRENTLFAGDIPIGLSFNDTIQKVGIYQVTVCAPLNGGKFPALEHILITLFTLFTFSFNFLFLLL
jgi:hypothetical protein